ncbi:hypothetical protein DFH29DRAFT_1005786 [Suillus ampliporus]|nr:hypothetical protein DFH29DRAFT_1005786 [Suillus ampliporus]
MPPKYKTEQQRLEARQQSKQRYYERCCWRKRLGATKVTQQLLLKLDHLWVSLGYQPGPSQYTVLECQSLKLVRDADNEGWQAVRPRCEGMLVEVQGLLSEAHELLASSLRVDGSCTEYLLTSSAAAVDAVHCDVLEEGLTLMDNSMDNYFERLQHDQLVWQKVLSNLHAQRAEAQQAQRQASSSSRVADDHELYHKHSCFSRTASGRISTETEFFHAAEGTAQTSHVPPLVSETLMEEFNFDFDSSTPDGDFVDPAYENYLAESTLGPKKRIRPIGVR